MTLYTIGYSGYSRDEFLKEIRRHSIDCIVDVRSNPHSRYFSDYDKESIALFLKDNQILYRHYDKEFGARQEDRRYYTGGILDFAKFVKSDAFQSGIQKIVSGMQQGYTFVLLCAEKDPASCHRACMVTREFAKAGIHVVHLSPGAEETQTKLEVRLLEAYFPERDQLTLFGSPKTDAELLDEAYALRNKEIGYAIIDN